MLHPLPITPAARALASTITPPGSKSLSNRALLAAALADAESRLAGLLDCEDTRLMGQALQTLGLKLELDWERGQASVTGGGGQFPNQTAQLYCGNSGTTIRFLAAALAAAGGQYELDGNSRMRQRPIADLLDALGQLGSPAHPLLGTNCPPIAIDSAGWPGGSVTVRGDKSSQFLSGLLMAAPLARSPVTIQVAGPLVSLPYVEMTCQVMSHFGVRVDSLPGQVFVVQPQTYRSTHYQIEPDASAASYFFGAAAICGGTVTVPGLGSHSLQGDIRFVELLAQMGCEVEFTPECTTVTGPARRGIACTMTDISDTVQTLAAVALFVEGPTSIRGVAHIRHKESDRIGDLARELRRVGATVEEFADGLQITPGPLRPTVFQTYEDHRMAMSLALVGLKQPGISIAQPDCVSKTYPRYFDDLCRITVGG
ncbi:MAG: 3-phosphoshikimate 1-carboxyvinyltransferase [Planctomycetota bacterium]